MDCAEPRFDPALRSRQHTLTPPKTALGRLGYAALARLERFIATVSMHGDPVVYRNRDFPWVEAVEAGWREVRAELDAVMGERERMPSFQDILPEVGTIQDDDAWKTFWLRGIAMDCRGNAVRCPRTMRLLERIPGVRSAFFSILAPGKHVPAHRGAYNGVLRLHLALQVPEPAGACCIRIGDQLHHWREGAVLIFDDSYNHEVWNDTAGYRVVLFVDFARPLRQPWHTLNGLLLDSGRLAPFLRAAGSRQRAWERRVYGIDGAADGGM